MGLRGGSLDGVGVILEEEGVSLSLGGGCWGLGLGSLGVEGAMVLGGEWLWGVRDWLVRVSLSGRWLESWRYERGLEVRGREKRE